MGSSSLIWASLIWGTIQIVGAVPMSLQVHCHLLTTPNDAVTARRLRLQNPHLSPFQLARLTSVPNEHRYLIEWMQKDLIQYEAGHRDVWQKRLQIRPDVLERTTLANICDKIQVRDTLDLIADIIRPGLPNMTMADFHRLVSAFAAPDHHPASQQRSEVDVTDPYGEQEWHKLWPTEGFLFTTDKIGFRRMALSYGLHIHYLGLISHLDLNATPHSFSMLPWEYLRHDLGHAEFISKHLPDADWAFIHQAYERLRISPGLNGRQRQMDDLVYFFWTHELGVRDWIWDLYKDIASDRHMRPWLEKIAGPDDWRPLLKQSVSRLVNFMKQHISFTTVA